MAALKKEYAKAIKAIDAAGGFQDEKAKNEMAKVGEIFTEFKYAPVFVATLTNELRGQVERVRSLERQIRDICVKTCKMPRRTFIETFPGSETDPAWLEKQMKVKKPYAEALKEQATEIEMLQSRIQHICNKSMLPINELK